MSSVSKAIAGAIVAPAALALGQSTGIVAIIPPDVQAPWWGYVAAYAVAAVVGYLGVYFAPRNTQ